MVGSGGYRVGPPGLLSFQSLDGHLVVPTDSTRGKRRLLE